MPTFRSHAVRKRNISQILTIDDPETAQRYAGHKSLETTLRHYKDIHEDQVHEAAAALAESWRDPRPHLHGGKLRGQKATGLDDEMRRLFGLGK